MKKVNEKFSVLLINNVPGEIVDRAFIVLTEEGSKASKHDILKEAESIINKGLISQYSNNMGKTQPKKVIDSNKNTLINMFVGFAMLSLLLMVYKFF